MLKVFTLGAVAALSLSTGASAQLFGGAFGDNTLGPEFVITFAADGSITTALNRFTRMRVFPTRVPMTALTTLTSASSITRATRSPALGCPLAHRTSAASTATA
jgi:hypothetical protein